MKNPGQKRSFFSLKRVVASGAYLPEIDGLRFIAIASVVVFHLMRMTEIHIGDYQTSGSSFQDGVQRLLSHGYFGVQLFFFISGFVLSLPYARHFLAGASQITYGTYLKRRVTRLEPPYVAALIIRYKPVMVAKNIGFFQLFPHFLASVVYLNAVFYRDYSILLGVAWSLEIEIQFYLLAPFLFRLLALHKHARRLIIICAIVLLVFLQGRYAPPFISIYGYAQFFLTGILLADFYVSGAATSVFNKNWIIPLAIACLAGIMYLPVNDPGAYTISSFFVQLAFPLLIGLLYYAILKNGILKNVFSYKFIPIIGGMCYSIYLLHYTIIAALGRFTLQFHVTNYYYPNLLLQIILLGIPVLIISCFFYFYVERPFMSKKWMDKLLKKDKRMETANMQSEE